MSDIKAQSPLMGILFNNGLEVGNLLDLIPIGVYICDAEGTIKSFNATVGQLWGRQSAAGTEEFCGFSKLFHPDGFPISKDASPVAQCLSSGVAIEDVDLVIEQADATFLTVRSSAAPIKDKVGNLIGVLASFYGTGCQQADQWQLKRKEYELQEICR